jgi:hypothetical protein
MGAIYASEACATCTIQAAAAFHAAGAVALCIASALSTAATPQGMGSVMCIATRLETVSMKTNQLHGTMVACAKVCSQKVSMRL